MKTRTIKDATSACQAGHETGRQNRPSWCLLQARQPSLQEQVCSWSVLTPGLTL